MYTLSSSAQTSIEIGSLSKGIDFYTHLIHAAFDGPFLDLFPSTLESVRRFFVAQGLIRTMFMRLFWCVAPRIFLESSNLYQTCPTARSPTKALALMKPMVLQPKDTGPPSP
jgi:hypothetical protein